METKTPTKSLGLAAFESKGELKANLTIFYIFYIWNRFLYCEYISNFNYILKPFEFTLRPLEDDDLHVEITHCGVCYSGI